MARRSLRPHLNQIRGWVRQGRTDAWIAHQLEATVQQIETFKRDNELAPAEADNGDAPGTDFGDEIDLRAEDDAKVAAEVEGGRGAQGRGGPPEGRGGGAPRRGRRGRGRRRPRPCGATPPGPPRWSWPRRRPDVPGPLEGTFDHGEDGYGLWLDPAVTDDPVYAEHWAGHRPVEITIEEDQIIIRRSGGEED